MNTLDNTYQKTNGQTLSADTWNGVVDKVNEIVETINTDGSSSGSGSAVIDPSGVISVNSRGNTIISSAKHINIEPLYDSTGSESGSYGDVQIKPGDDITLESHHRDITKRDEITVKTSNGKDGSAKAPVKLQFIASDITLSTKGKQVESGSNDGANVMNVNVTTGSGKGYLKVRAQAIDLRCEKHGGIALQPKGYDSQGNMNKIKFEHGGGDGLEFGTFNTEKSSLYTDEYRFKKDGVWKMATRETEVNTKTIIDEGTIPSGKEATAARKFVKQADDFYDIIDADDETASTNAIIKTAHAFNDGKNRHAKYSEKVTSSGNLKKTLEVETVVTITYEPSNEAVAVLTVPSEIADPNKIYTISDFKDAIKTVVIDDTAQKYGTAGDDGVTLSAGDVVTVDGSNYTIVENFSPSIDITSGADMSIKAKDGVLSLGGKTVEFGSDVIELGEMEDGLYAQYKLTKKNNSKPCDTLKIKVINNQTTPLLFDADSGTFAIESFYPEQTVTVPAKVAEPSTDEEAT